ncbi:MAG: 50S ribosomal protein L17 [Cyclobacteriaceae bacterium]|nr:50S ribosomal protein L17 [Cyclobacteriaceae bacterium]
MRHGKKINHLSRTTSHRKAMLSNMASSLIMHKRIVTTVAKAKALRKYVEPLITRAKEDSTHSRRMVFRYLQNKESVQELFNDVSERVMERAGGYTRILRTGNRLGDNASMCVIELVDYNESMLTEAKPQKSKTRRGRRSKTAATAATTAAVAEEVVTAETVEEADVEEATQDDVEETEAVAAADEVQQEVEAEAEASEEAAAEEAPAVEEPAVEEPAAESEAETAEESEDSAEESSQEEE